MGEQRNLHVTPGRGHSGSASAGYRAGLDLAFTEASDGQTSFPARRLSRITRALFMLAAFFCGWSLLRSSQVNVTLSDALLFMAMAIMLSHGEINRRPFGSLTVYWLLGLGLMLLGLLIGTVINGSVDRWVIVCAQYLFAFLLIPMIITGQPITLTRNLPALFMLGIAVSQLIGITASILFDYSDTKDLLGAGFLTGNGRLGAMSGEPNPNGAMIAYSLPILLYSLRQRIIPLGIGLICGVLLVWGLLASGSFTGFAAGLIAVAVYLAISGLGMLIRVAVIGSIGAALFLASGLPLPAAFEKRVAGALTTGDLDEAGTFVGRAELIDEAWELADDNAIVGLGVDQFRVVSVQGAPVHEFHLLIWNEGGIVAFVGLVMLLLTLVGAAFVVVSRSRVEGALILAVVAVFNVYTFSVPHMYSRAWILPVFLAMSTYFARRVTGPNPKDQVRRIQ